MGRFIDLTGQRFGRLIVIKRAENHIKPNGQKVVQWQCECDCGKQNVIIRGDSLKNGNTKSCGCLFIEKSKEFMSNLNKKYNTYDLSNEYGIGWTDNTNTSFYFDKEDYDKIKDYCWSESDRGYIRTSINGHNNFLHRHILGLNKEDREVVDHINHNVKDNRKMNLRIVSQSENMMNRKCGSHNTSGIIGVYYSQRDKVWRVQITKKGKVISGGAFKQKIDAIKKRKELENIYFGEYSYSNSVMVGDVDEEEI